MNITETLTQAVSAALRELYAIEAPASAIVLQDTRREFRGDYTLVVFPYVKQARKAPEAVAQEIGTHMQEHVDVVCGFNVVKGFLNIEVADSYWQRFIAETAQNANYGMAENKAGEAPVVVEYSSPNTNKPLHLGHIRNNLLGWSVSRLLEAAGANV